MAYVRVSEEVLAKAEELARRLRVDVDQLVAVVLDVLGSYSNEIEAWARDLRVKREHLVESVFEELVFYGVEAKNNLVDRLLNALRARGRFELESLTLDPRNGSLEVELVALEGSDLEADRVIIGWSPTGVIVEAYYYLEEYETPPLPRKTKNNIDISYLPDEHAILITATGQTIEDIPPIHVLDKIALRQR